MDKLGGLGGLGNADGIKGKIAGEAKEVSESNFRVSLR